MLWLPSLGSCLASHPVVTFLPFTRSQRVEANTCLPSLCQTDNISGIKNRCVETPWYALLNWYGSFVQLSSGGLVCIIHISAVEKIMHTPQAVWSCTCYVYALFLVIAYSVVAVTACLGVWCDRTDSSLVRYRSARANFTVSVWQLLSQLFPRLISLTWPTQRLGNAVSPRPRTLKPKAEPVLSCSQLPGSLRIPIRSSLGIQGLDPYDLPGQEKRKTSLLVTWT